MNIRYRVTLSAEERAQLEGLVTGGKGPVRRLKRAQILLAADRGDTAETIARVVVVGVSTVYRTRQRFVEEGFEEALSEEPRRGKERKLSAREELRCQKRQEMLGPVADLDAVVAGPQLPLQGA